MRRLGWKPTTMFNDGIKITIEWYKYHTDWMKNALVENIKSTTIRCMARDNYSLLLFKGLNLVF